MKKIIITIMAILLITSVATIAWNPSPRYNPFEVLWNAVNDLISRMSSVEERVDVLENTTFESNPDELLLLLNQTQNQIILLENRIEYLENALIGIIPNYITILLSELGINEGNDDFHSFYYNTSVVNSEIENDEVTITSVSAGETSIFISDGEINPLQFTARAFIDVSVDSNLNVSVDKILPWISGGWTGFYATESCTINMVEILDICFRDVIDIQYDIEGIVDVRTKGPGSDEYFVISEQEGEVLVTILGEYGKTATIEVVVADNLSITHYKINPYEAPPVPTLVVSPNKGYIHVAELLPNKSVVLRIADGPVALYEWVYDIGGDGEIYFETDDYYLLQPGNEVKIRDYDTQEELGSVIISDVKVIDVGIETIDMSANFIYGDASNTEIVYLVLQDDHLEDWMEFVVDSSSGSWHIEDFDGEYQMSESSKGVVEVRNDGQKSGTRAYWSVQDSIWQGNWSGSLDLTNYVPESFNSNDYEQLWFDGELLTTSNTVTGTLGVFMKENTYYVLYDVWNISASFANKLKSSIEGTISSPKYQGNFSLYEVDYTMNKWYGWLELNDGEHVELSYVWEGYRRFPSCFDGVQNQDETDVDCGGPCAPCGDGNNCVANSDCVSSVCTGSICQAPTCNDGVWNGAETDVDCGGPCAPCGGGKNCFINSDCSSENCNNGICI